MSFNIVDMIKDQLTDQVVGYVGNMLGGDSNQGSSVLSAAVPAILGSLMHSSSEPSGAEAIFNSINKTDDSILDNIGDMLSGDNSGSLMSMGADLLGSAFGGNNSTMGSIVDAVSNFSGSDKGATKSIMGLLAPIIFSVIKKQLMGGDGKGFSIGSLVDMFTGQKDNINAALPKGLDLNLGNSSYKAPRNIEPQGKSALGKLLPLALLVGAGWIAYNMFFSGNKTVEHTNNSVTQEINMANLGQNVTGTMTSLVSTLKGIKDVSSAKAAVSTLTEATNNLGSYASMLDKLPIDARGKVTKYVMDYLPQLETLLNNVSSIPGVGPVLKPVVENLSSKLALFK